MSTYPAFSPKKPPRLGLGWHILAGLLRLFSPQRYGLVLCVALPTLLTAVYQELIAADIYVSESAFGVRLDHGQQMGSELGMVLPGLSYTSGQQDQLTVNKFITSRGMVEALLKNVDLKGIYHSTHADPLARLPASANHEDLLSYYQRMVAMSYDERAQITTLHVKAFSAKEAALLNEAILAQADRFVNELALNMRQGGIAFAEQQLELSEKEMAKANDALRTFREANKNYNPEKSTGAVGAMLEQLGQKIIEKRVELETARNIMTSNNQQVRNLQHQIAALEHQFAEQNKQLTGGGDTTLGRQIEQYTTVAMQQEFTLKRYRMALTALEAAQAEAGRKTIYLTRIVPPSLPDIAVEPRRLYHIGSVFFLSLAAYAMALLIAASIGDHIRK